MIRKLYPADQIENYLYIDLIVLVFLFYNVLSYGQSFGLAGSLFLLILFIGVYYILLWYRDWRQLLAALVGYGILTVFGMFYSDWMVLYGFVIADFLGRIQSRAYMFVGMAGILTMFSAVHWYNNGDFLSLLQTVMFPVLILQLTAPVVRRILEHSKSLKKELDTANEKIERYIQEEERHRIARDLHDTLGQTLNMIKLKSELAIRLIDKNSGQAKSEMNEVLDTSRFALKQVRDLVTSMKHVPLDEEIEHAGKLLRAAGIRLVVREEPSPLQLSKVTETMLSLSVRESFTNIVKHSQARECIVTKDYKDGWLYITIEDDGVGFTSESTKGNGLDSIRERLRLLQGHTKIKHSSAGGVEITLSIPVKG